MMNLAGLRLDGRRPGELREVRATLGGSGGHDGSAYLEMGQTKVLAQVVGPHDLGAGRRAGGDDACHIHVHFLHAPFAGLERRQRRSNDKPSLELSLAVQSSLAAAVLVDSYPQTQLDVYVTLLQDDGGRLPACLNAATLAVLDAGVSMNDMLVACSAGLVQGSGVGADVPVVDMSHREQGGGGAFLPVAILPHTEEVVLAQMDAKLPLQALQPVLATAIAGCHQVHAVFQEALRARCEFLLSARDFGGSEAAARALATAGGGAAAGGDDDDDDDDDDELDDELDNDEEGTGGEGSAGAEGQPRNGVDDARRKFSMDQDSDSGDVGSGS